MVNPGIWNPKNFNDAPCAIPVIGRMPPAMYQLAKTHLYFTISEVEADWNELMVLQWPFSTSISEQLDLQCSQHTCHRLPSTVLRLCPITYTTPWVKKHLSSSSYFNFIFQHNIKQIRITTVEYKNMPEGWQKSKRSLNWPPTCILYNNNNTNDKRKKEVQIGVTCRTKQTSLSNIIRTVQCNS